MKENKKIGTELYATYNKLLLDVQELNNILDRIKKKIILDELINKIKGEK